MIKDNDCGPPDNSRLKRTDASLQRRIVNYLSQRLPSMAAITVEVRDSTVILRGRVPSQSIQARCGDCCRHVAGVLNVLDHLQVADPTNR